MSILIIGVGGVGCRLAEKLNKENMPGVNCLGVDFGHEIGDPSLGARRINLAGNYNYSLGTLKDKNIQRILIEKNKDILKEIIENGVENDWDNPSDGFIFNYESKGLWDQ